MPTLDQPKLTKLARRSARAFPPVEGSGGFEYIIRMAAKLHLFIFLDEEISFWGYQARRNGDARTGDELLRGRVMANGREQQNDFDLICDDAQIIERKLTLISGTNAINTCQLYLRGWYEWE